MKNKKNEFIPHIDVANEEIERLHAELEKAGIQVPEHQERGPRFFERRRLGLEPRPRSAERIAPGAELRGLARAIAANTRQQEQRQR
jgi:hypothetical protein